jgi:hypothetical protein
VWPQPTQTTLVILSVYSAAPTITATPSNISVGPINASDTLAYSCREYQ